MGALNRGQKLQLFKEGFLPREIKALDEATGGFVGSEVSPSHKVPQKLKFNSKPFRAMRKSRVRYIQDLRKQGWTGDEIKKQLVSYYSLKAGRSVWDFLKMEYQPHRKLTDFMDAVKRKIRSRVSRSLGRAYGRQMRPSNRPKYLPKRPRYPSRYSAIMRPIRRLIRRRA